MSLVPSFKQRDRAPDSAAVLQGLLIVSPDGRIQFATARAYLWMRDFFRATSPVDRVPKGLTYWLYDGTSKVPSSTFIVEQSGRQLNIRLICREANSVCLLLEQCLGIPASDRRFRALTKRQTEVLSWVARGKTNAEIGQIMSLRTRTIGKYLERIFPKLGVENRTAAASFALGTNGDR
jgi:DNA-binding CsgD family transcriptional regulator